MKMDAVIVGAGLAGLAAAETLAEAGLEVVVLERGDAPGAKNVTGGRLYSSSIRELFPDWWESAPLERPVTKEAWTLLDGNRSLNIGFSDEALGGEKPLSHTVLRATFDGWLGERVMEKGVFVIPQKTVTELIMDNGKVKGVKLDDEEIEADVVLACDGILSFIGRQAGLTGLIAPKAAAVGVKEIIGLPANVIEDRFNLDPGEGGAELFVGDISKGMLGGGFCYTNQESISLGMVIGVSDLMTKWGKEKVPALFEAFKNGPRVRNLIRGGELLEYSAHLIPEGGAASVGKLAGDGVLLCGDAAGLALNMGFTVRGMEFAVASGRYAADSVIEAKKSGDFSAKGLASYEKRLKTSFVFKYLEAYREMPHLLENPAIYNRYPKETLDLLSKVVTLNSQAPTKLYPLIWEFMRRNALNWSDINFFKNLRKL